MQARRLVFTGSIAGLGPAAGVRLVVGVWAESPFGAFADVMVQTRDDHRILLAPNSRVADFIASTYAFDQVSSDWSAPRRRPAGWW